MLAIGTDVLGLVGSGVAALAVIGAAWLTSRRDMAKLEAKLDSMQRQVETNGSNKTLGELAELMYEDLQATKRDLAAHQRRTDAHGLKRGG